MKNSSFAFVIFGVMFIMSLFVYMPFSDTVNLTDEGTFLEGEYNVDTAWSDKGTLTGDMQTDDEIIYTGSNEQGTWTSRIIEGENFNFITLNALTNPLDGDINYTINLWDNGINETPDKTFNGTINEADFQQNFTDLESYQSFEIVIDIDETAGSNNKRPNVDSLNVEYVENLDRQGLGFNESMFQVFTLMVLIGAGLLALTNSF